MFFLFSVCNLDLTTVYVNTVQKLQSQLETQGSGPLPLSLHLVQKLGVSKPAIRWPQPPCFCPGDAMFFYTVTNIRRSKIKL